MEEPSWALHIDIYFLTSTNSAAAIVYDLWLKLSPTCRLTVEIPGGWKVSRLKRSVIVPIVIIIIIY